MKWNKDLKIKNNDILSSIIKWWDNWVRWKWNWQSSPYEDTFKTSLRASNQRYLHNNHLLRNHLRDAYSACLYSLTFMHLFFLRFYHYHLSFYSFSFLGWIHIIKGIGNEKIVLYTFISPKQNIFMYNIIIITTIQILGKQKIQVTHFDQKKKNRKNRKWRVRCKEWKKK